MSKEDKSMRNDLKVALIAVAIIAGMAILAVACVAGTNNKAVRLEEHIASARSEIGVQYKRRADLMPNLVECVKAYDRHEYETLVAIINGRGYDEGDVQSRIMAVAEAYPALESSANYRELMNELATTENLIANHRDNYNEWVRAYRQFVRAFPNKRFLGLTGYKVKTYEYLEYEASEDAPAVQFR